MWLAIPVLALLAGPVKRVNAIPVVASSCAGTAARSGYAITWDPDRQKVLIFGGETPDNALSADTWGWDGRRWECVATGNPGGPRPRDAAMLAYDAGRHVLVLYGGRVGREGLRDTWELDQTGWHLRNNSGPSPDPHGVMGWNAGRGGVVLYHSLGDDSPARATWLWDGRAWHKVADGPDQEFPDALFASTDTAPAALITAKPTGTNDAFAASLYRWAGAGWVRMTTTGDVPLFSPQAPAARTANGAILYAGFEADQSVSTFVLDGTVWRKYAGVLPSRRKGAQMVYDPIRRVAVLHAGDDGQRVLNDTWEWDGAAWREVPRQ
ncbi:MAG: kelch repeat-containing protein [Gemmatimonadota bacterium]